MIKRAGVRRSMVLAGWLVVALGRAGLAQGVPTPPGPDRLDDPAYVAKLLSNASALCDGGLTRTLNELKAELDRAGLESSVDLAPASASELPLPELYTRRCRSVLTVARAYKCDKCHNWHLGNEATAFALTANGVLATCRHVFELPEDGPMIVADQEGNVFPVREILASSAADDVAIFRVGLDASQPAGVPAPEPVPLRDSAVVGSAVNVVSHPGNQHYVLTRGIVSRRFGKLGGISGRDESRRQVPTPVLNITADYAVGSSGAPVLDDAGNAVAMVVSTNTIHADGKKDGETQMVVRNCIAAGQIQHLVRPASAVAVGAGPNAHP